MEDIIPEIYDPKKCVFCGTCVVMCPFSALTLKKDGEVIELNDIQIVKENVVPKLEFEAKKINDIAAFIADVLEAIEEGKSTWGKMFDRLGSFYDKRFHGTHWRDDKAEYWENKLKQELFF